MADKMICPGCDAYLSRVLEAFIEGLPCPVCGLPADAAVEIEKARKRGADEKLIQRAVDAETRAAKAEREAGWLHGRISRLQVILSEKMPEENDGF